MTQSAVLHSVFGSIFEGPVPKPIGEANGGNLDMLQAAKSGSRSQLLDSPTKQLRIQTRRIDGNLDSPYVPGWCLAHVLYDNRERPCIWKDDRIVLPEHALRLGIDLSIHSRQAEGER